MIREYIFNGGYKITNVTESDMMIMENDPEEFWAEVVEIGDNAFEGVKSCKNIVIPGSVKVIGTEAFRNSGFENIEIEEGVEEIRDRAFYSSAITSVNTENGVSIPKSVKKIGSKAFANCKNIKYAYIPSEVKEIGSFAFARSGVIEGVIVCGDSTKIYKGMFYGCKHMTFVDMPNIKRIPDFMFSNTGFAHISIPNNVIEIGKGAFFECVNMQSVSISSAITFIPEIAFSRCGMNSVVIPIGVKEIGKRAFDKTGIKRIVISETTNIDEEAFKAEADRTKVSDKSDIEIAYICHNNQIISVFDNNQMNDYISDKNQITPTITSFIQQ